MIYLSKSVFYQGSLSADLTLQAEKLARFRLREPTVVQDGRGSEGRRRVIGIRGAEGGHIRVGESCRWI